QVKPLPFDLNVFVGHEDLLFLLHLEAAQSQFMHQGPFIHYLQESRPQQAMHFDGCTNDLMSDSLIFSRNRFMAHVWSSFVSFVVDSAAFRQSSWATM